ncbi:hypothetical protein BP6252_06384 [Coleophoma cylindrospora]|uniref:Cyanovirin-N domain-containing protein n=1 Tax=Coleophoma cylindrospora TaxID=1849047 RepID=A0A3D8RMD2_9HELO|nr:hypothetical protein BP6252_06384 [Coleophoma cylindrospora]
MVKLSLVTALLATGIGCTASPTPATKNEIFVKGQGHFVLSPVLRANTIAARQEPPNTPSNVTNSLYLTDAGELTSSWDQAARYLMISDDEGNARVVLAAEESDTISISAARVGNQSLQPLTSDSLRRTKKLPRELAVETRNITFASDHVACLRGCAFELLADQQGIGNEDDGNLTALQKLSKGCTSCMGDLFAEVFSICSINCTGNHETCFDCVAPLYLDIAMKFASNEDRRHGKRNIWFLDSNQNEQPKPALDPKELQWSCLRNCSNTAGIIDEQMCQQCIGVWLSAVSPQSSILSRDISGAQVCGEGGPASFPGNARDVVSNDDEGFEDDDGDLNTTDEDPGDDNGDLDTTDGDREVDDEFTEEDLEQCTAICEQDETSDTCSECNARFLVTAGFEMEILYATISIPNSSVPAGMTNNTKSLLKLQEVDESCDNSYKQRRDKKHLLCTRLPIHDPIPAQVRQSSSKLMISRDEFQVPGGMSTCPCPLNQAFCTCHGANTPTAISARDSQEESSEGKFAFFSLVWRPQKLDNGLGLDGYQVKFCVADVLEVDKPVYAVMTKSITAEIECAEVELQVIFDPVSPISEAGGH